MLSEVVMDTERKLYLANLPQDIAEAGCPCARASGLRILPWQEELREVFGVYGRIEEACSRRTTHFTRIDLSRIPVN